MTIDDLATAMQKEFLAIRQEFANIHEELEIMRGDIGMLHAEISGLVTREEFEKAINGIHSELNHAFVWMRELDGRVGFLESKAIPKRGS